MMLTTQMQRDWKQPKLVMVLDLQWDRSGSRLLLSVLVWTCPGSRGSCLSQYRYISGPSFFFASSFCFCLNVRTVAMAGTYIYAGDCRLRKDHCSLAILLTRSVADLRAGSSPSVDWKQGYGKSHVYIQRYVHARTACVRLFVRFPWEKQQLMLYSCCCC